MKLKKELNLLDVFCIASGAMIGSGLFILPGLIELYYVTLQKLSPEDLGFVRITALSFIAMPISVAWRAHREGLAAWHRKPMAVLAGNGIYMVVVIGCGFLALVSGVPGYLICSGALTLASLVSGFIIRAIIDWPREKAIAVKQTTAADMPVH